MARAKIGDIIEIPTTKGFSYAQYTHQHAQWGGLIRVFERFYASRPTAVCSVVNDTVRITTFVAFKKIVSDGFFAVAGNCDLPTHLQIFPVFRDGFPDAVTKKIDVWWLWDGTEEQRVGALTEKMRALPQLSLMTASFLRDRIESDWRVEKDYL